MLSPYCWSYPAKRFVQVGIIVDYADASAGDPSACFFSGLLKLAKDPFSGDAYQLFLKSANGHHAAGCFQAATCLLNGQGTTPDPGLAYKYLRDSADKSFADALCRLGSGHRDGIFQGVVNSRQAALCFASGAWQNHSESKTQLTALLEEDSKAGAPPWSPEWSLEVSLLLPKQVQSRMYCFVLCMRRIKVFPWEVSLHCLSFIATRSSNVNGTGK